MAGEGYLPARREDANVVAAFALLLGEYEGGLRVVHLARYLQEGLVRQARRAADDGELVPGVLLFGEDVHDGEAEVHRRLLSVVRVARGHPHDAYEHLEGCPVGFVGPRSEERGVGT